MLRPPTAVGARDKLLLRVAKDVHAAPKACYYYRTVLVVDMKRTQEIAQTGSVAHVVSREHRAAVGKALRGKIPRKQHGRWKEAKGRPNPIDILRKADPRRMKELVPIRYGRMLQSPFSFYRGAAEVMASDLAQMPNTDLKVQACGDCHLMNFGGFATPERNIIFDINDFDETLPAPWEWDVKAAWRLNCTRCADLSDYPMVKARDCAVTSARSYREHMREFSRMDPLRVWYTKITAEDFIARTTEGIAETGYDAGSTKTAAHSGSELDFPKAGRTVWAGRSASTDHPPLIFHPEQRPVLRNFRKNCEQILLAYRESLPDDRRILLDRYRVVDEAIKVVGSRQRRAEMLDRFADVRK